MENAYRRGYWILVGLMLGQILFMYFNPIQVGVRMKRTLIVDIDSTTVVIVPEEIKDMSNNPYYPTKLIGFVNKDTIYINFVPHDEEPIDTIRKAVLKTEY